ncbi:uncharacterized protein N7483_004588 [Penicillium malachiteum]|uniref:uncharacterized protein n=1 Tax=Penicillium malachiteum TaxID=1324776 RepID=UPI002547429C|nr:uncharacterized protein N7483_004588 [Penicillium malachiteum]KAJ5730080.1 hypothetical protein N7483_004588 [Penicillium malachiteum]
MEAEQVSDSLTHPLTHSTIRLQETSFSTFSTSSTLSPSFKVDEGYSDETRSQSDKELVATENVMMLPDWVLAQSESDRAELAFSLLRSLSTSTLAGVVERINPLLHMDPVFKLPPELTFEIFSYLDAATLLNATLASRSWRTRILDSGLWKVLYINEGWRADLGAIRNFEQEHPEPLSPQTRRSRPLHSESDIGEPKHKKRVPPTWLTSRSTEGQSVIRPNGQAHPEPDNEGDHHMADVNGTHMSPPADLNILQPASIPQPPSLLQPPLQPSLLVRRPNGTSKINWAYLYKQRRRLEANWHQGRFKNFQLPHPMHPEEAHRECVYAIQFQGKWLVSGSRDRTLRVWDLKTKRLWHRPLVGHEKSVLCLQFDPSPEQDVIISGSSDRSVIVWKFSTGQKIHRISEAHTDSVLNLKFDHRYLVTCSKDRTVKVWNRKELSVTDDDYPRICKGGSANFPSHIIDLNEVAPSMLEAGLANSKFNSLAPYSLLMGIEGHGAAVNAMQLHGNEIVTASGDRMIKVWNVRTGSCLKTLMGHEKGIACVQFDSRRIISGSNDNTVRIYDHISGAEVAVLRGHQNLVRTVQAGFGDPPGADEDLRREALEVENAFWKAQQEGAPVDLGRRALRRAGYTSNTAGSRDPRDISALGAKIPPGGGGSVWGRIVSGSYDESILIWHKDHDGVWSINHRLRQADAIANASADTLTPMARAAVSAQARQLHAQASGNLGPGPGPAAGPSLTPVPASSSTRSERESETEGMNDVLANHFHNNQVPGPAQAGDVGQPHQTNGQATPQADRNTIQHQQQQQQQLADAQMQAAQQLVPHHHHHHHQRPRVAQPAVPTSRVFKVQFDSRKIVCASVDPRIVGWDFANDDEDIIEACPFFESL